MNWYCVVRMSATELIGILSCLSVRRQCLLSCFHSVLGWYGGEAAYLSPFLRSANGVSVGVCCVRVGVCWLLDRRRWCGCPEWARGSSGSNVLLLYEHVDGVGVALRPSDASDLKNHAHLAALAAVPVPPNLPSLTPSPPSPPLSPSPFPYGPAAFFFLSSVHSTLSSGISGKVSKTHSSISACKSP